VDTTTVIRPLLFVLLCAVAFAVVAAVPPRMPLTTAALAAPVSLLLTGIFVRWEGIAQSDAGVELTLWTLPKVAAGVLAGLLLVTVWSLLVAGLHAPRPASVEWAITFMLLATREELSFHGYPLLRLNDRFGYWPAQLTIAILFGIEHKIAGWTWIAAFGGAAFGSLLFGAVAIATRGLAAPIGMHAAWNFGQSLTAPPSPTLRSTLTFAALCTLSVFVVNWLSSRYGEVRADHDGSGGPRSRHHEPG
jgi:membrane protease YdiL (CAAX protease family)